MYISNNNKIGTFLIYIFIVFITTVGDSCTKRESKIEVLDTKYLQLSFLRKDETLEIEEIKGNPLVINLWASWCTPCRKEMPFLQEMWEEYKKRGVIFLGINVLDDKSNALKFIETERISFPNLYDAEGKILGTYSLTSLPVTLFVDRKGFIKHKEYGPYIGKEAKEKFLHNIKEITNGK